MQMTWIEERITCYEESHHMRFPSWSKQRSHQVSEMSQMTLTSPGWSRIL